MSSWGFYFYCSRSFDQAGTLSLRGPAQFTDEARSAEFDGMGCMGWTEDQKCPSNFFILCEYIGNVYEAERHKPGHPRFPGLSIPSNYLFYFSTLRGRILPKCERNGLARVNRFTRVLWQKYFFLISTTR